VSTPRPDRSLADALRSEDRVIAAELRPPRAELSAHAGIDAWIDTYHAVRSLTRRGSFVCLTDSAVGSHEEDNLRHLTINLGADVPRARVVPFLTAKHSLDYCLSYADRAVEQGFPALVVLGGDRSVGPPRALAHAWQLRELIRRRQPGLALGGWANPHSDAAPQVGFLLEAHATADFYLTQVVSHHDAARVERYLAEARRLGLGLEGVFGVFFYRSANPQTLALLRGFMPVPVEAIAAEFAAGATAEEICARSLRQLADLGVRHFYISNLPVTRAAATLDRILRLAGLA